jgi:hypothetical protein
MSDGRNGCRLAAVRAAHPALCSAEREAYLLVIDKGGARLPHTCTMCVRSLVHTYCVWEVGL